MLGGENKSMLRRSVRSTGLLPKIVSERVTKSNRPGNSAFLMKGPLKEALLENLEQNILKSLGWFNCELKSIFINDLNQNNNQRMDFWFRTYSMLRWIDKFKQS